MSQSPSQDTGPTLRRSAVIGGILGLGLIAAVLVGFEPLAGVNRGLGLLGLAIVGCLPVLVAVVIHAARHSPERREWWSERTDPARPPRPAYGPRPALPAKPSLPKLHQPVVARTYGGNGQDAKAAAQAFERDAARMTQQGYMVATKAKQRGKGGTITVTYQVSAAGKRADEAALQAYQLVLAAWEQDLVRAKASIAEWEGRKQRLDAAYAVATTAWLQARRGAIQAGTAGARGQAATAGAPTHQQDALTPTAFPPRISAGIVGAGLMGSLVILGIIGGGPAPSPAPASLVTTPLVGWSAGSPSPAPSPSPRPTPSPRADLAVVPRATQAMARPTVAPQPTATPTPSPTEEPTLVQEPTPKPKPTPVTFHSDDYVTVGKSGREFDGTNGTYTWTDVNFNQTLATAAWKVKATKRCEFRWVFDPELGGRIGRSITVPAGATFRGSRQFVSDKDWGRVRVATTCKTWSLDLTSYRPPRGWNPWGFNFTPGSRIYNAPGDFCSYFDCIPSFWDSTNGYVAQCRDGMFSHSGGRPGACSYHDGPRRPLFRH